MTRRSLTLSLLGLVMGCSSSTWIVVDLEGAESGWFSFPVAGEIAGQRFRVDRPASVRIELPTAPASGYIRGTVAGRIFWLPVTAGRDTVVIDHPCCVYAFVDRAVDLDQWADCPDRSDECPSGTEHLYPGRAGDDLCSGSARCVVMPRLLMRRREDGPASAVIDIADDWIVPLAGPGEEALPIPVPRGVDAFVKIRPRQGADPVYVAVPTGRCVEVSMGADDIDAVIDLGPLRRNHAGWSCDVRNAP